MTSWKPQRELAALFLLNSSKDFLPAATQFTAPALVVPHGAAAAPGSPHSPEGRWPEDTSASPVCHPPCLHPLHSTVLRQHSAFCLVRQAVLLPPCRIRTAGRPEAAACARTAAERLWRDLQGTQLWWQRPSPCSQSCTSLSPAIANS